MGFRVADPKRLRIAALVATIVGAAWIIFGSTRGIVLLLGIPIMALGVAGFDLARQGRASMRQIALVVTIVAGGLAMWAFFVIIFMGVLDEGSASWFWYVLLLVSVGLAVAGLLMIRRPTVGAAVSNVVAGAKRARSGKRAQRGRHAAPPPRAALERRSSVPRSGT